MVLSVFKSGDELFNQGVDLIKRKEYPKARKNFEKTIEKGGRESGLARVYVDMIDVCLERDSSARYNKLAATLATVNEPFVFGLTEVEPGRLRTECLLLAERMNVGNISAGDPTQLKDKGDRFLAVANKYQQQIGNDNITLSEIVGLQVNTGNKEAMYIKAWGFENLALGAVQSDPKKAAEMLQTVFTLRQQLGEDSKSIMNLINMYSRSVKCWICGRPTTGEGIHFHTLSSDVTLLMRKSDGDLLKSTTEDYSSLYVCRPCYTAFSRRADAIARQYHDTAMREMRAMEARLQAEIRNLNSAMMALRR
jgi:hypothetical protein